MVITLKKVWWLWHYICIQSYNWQKGVLSGLYVQKYSEEGAESHSYLTLYPLHRLLGWYSQSRVMTFANTEGSTTKTESSFEKAEGGMKENLHWNHEKPEL